MRATIITIGNEILIGQIVDTNSAYIATELNGIGVAVDYIESIADSALAITGALDRALMGSDIVIITGGIGPTKDDITKSTLASYFGMELVQNGEVAEHVKAITERLNIPYNELNQAQSLVPDGCWVLFNAHGTAPGMWLERDGKVVVSLPGVPFEMKPLLNNHVLPKLKSTFTLGHVVHHTIVTYGIPESLLADRLEAWEGALPEELNLAYLPNPNFLRLRLSAYDVVDLARIEAMIAEQRAKLEAIIGDNILGGSGATLEAVTSDMLRKRGETLSVAESCTGGAIASRYTALSGASDIFMGGVVAYSNSVKMSLLGVQEEVLESYGAVSEQVACQMAEGVRRVAGSTYGISTTGIAGPTGGSDEKPVGTVWIGLSTPERTFAIKKVYDTLRAENIARFSSNAIELLRKELFGN